MTTELSLKDCSTCKKRRIRCDRKIPSCFKCSKRNLTCPGYGSALRWANGIAVRGRFKGLNVPGTTNPTSISTLEPSDCSTRQDDLFPKTLSSCEELVSNFPKKLIVEHLLDHYDKHIAGLMVWLDSERNAYRRLVLPLARLQPVLLLAILAVSDEHLAAQHNIQSLFSKMARDKVIFMITQEAQQLTARLAQGEDFKGAIDCETVEWMLASILILSNYEMVGHESSAWQSHRNAARTLINAFPVAEYRNHELYMFLRNQLSIYDILACTTSFESESSVGIVLPSEEGTDMLFDEYLRLLHKVTLYSRNTDACSVGSFDFGTAKELRGAFVLAAGATLMASGMLLAKQEPARKDFTYLVDIYHHAGLLYSYRCLYSPEAVQLDVAYCTARLFEQLDDLKQISACTQNLPWPLFIAGAESHGDTHRQEAVVKLYQTLISTTGFSHYNNVLQFLTKFWAGQEENWLSFARKWEASGHRFAAV